MKEYTDTREFIDVNEKAQNLILYISHKMCEERGFGATVLNKLLYYIDSIAYLRHGKPITDFKYVRQDKGATPEPRMFLPLKKQMFDKGMAEEISVPYFGKPQKRIVPLKEFNSELFTTDEIVLIDEILEFFRSTNATLISDFNHKEMAWEFATDREELPYYTYLLTKAPIEDEDINWANKKIDEYETLRYR